MSINKVLISADLLRPVLVNDTNKMLACDHKARIYKYYYALEYQLRQVLNVPIEPFSSDNTDFDFYKFYSLCGIELKDIYSWLKIYDLEIIPQEAIEYYKKYIENSLVIYHEAPNIIKKIHNILNIPYICINVHPVRFLDDHLWGMLTNEKKIFDNIKKYQIDERGFYLQANLIKAQVKSWFDSAYKKNSLLFTGQTNVDQSLYLNKSVMTIFDFEDKIKEFGEKYSKVYYKAHPYNDNLSEIRKFLKQFDFVEEINENFYKLCADDNISAVASITSGTLYEAKYFGKESIFLGKPYINLDYSKNCEFSENTTLSIYRDFLTPQFWADALQDVLDVKKDVPNLNLPYRSNEIRTAFGDYWGQTELDPCVNMNKKQVLNVQDMLKESEKNIYNYKHECNNSIAELKNLVKNEFDKKVTKFFYREINGQKRIVHLGPIKISYKQNED